MDRDIMIVKVFEGITKEDASHIKEVLNKEYGAKWLILLCNVLKDNSFKFEFIHPSTFVSAPCNK